MKRLCSITLGHVLSRVAQNSLLKYISSYVDKKRLYCNLWKKIYQTPRSLILFYLPMTTSTTPEQQILLYSSRIGIQQQRSHTSYVCIPIQLYVHSKEKISIPSFGASTCRSNYYSLQ